MRAILVAAVVFVAALAGCSGKKDADEHLTYECTDGTVINEEDYEGVLNESLSDDDVIKYLKTKCLKGTGTGTSTGTGTGTVLPANKMPILKVAVTNFAGNATNVTLLDGNLTFDASGSSDPDGAISLIAVTVTDSNTSYTKGLYNAAKKTFTKATFTFDRAGPVNVSVTMVDDRAGFNSSMFQIYVNQVQDLKGGALQGPVQIGTPLTHACKGASDGLGPQGPVAHSQYFSNITIVLVPGATWIEATPDDKSRITICDADAKVISDVGASDTITSNNGATPLPMPSSGIKNYKIAFYAEEANTDVAALVTVHYEPRPVTA